MNTGKKIVLNTVALYAKNVINIIISLWSVPLVLKALGESDYGLYSLVAGVVAMLGFLNTSMTVSTQRYMSVTMGKQDIKELDKVYNTSKALHLILGISLILIFEVCALFLFNGALNISPERVSAAKIVYQIIVISTFLTIITVPYYATINAHEDLFVFSLIGIVDSVLRLLLSFSLYVISWDGLIWYAIGLALISLLSVVVSRSYVISKYKVLSNNVHRNFNLELLKEMFVFAGWNAFGSLAVIGRNQGVAIVLNRFFGTVVNAAYGIANQISAAMTTFSAVLQQAINPQLMKSEGANNRERMLSISYIFSKFSILVVAIMTVPLFVELPYVLNLWLGNYPENTLEFSRLILIFALLYQCSMGIMSAIQSGGRIKAYQITMSILILLNIPVSILLLWMEFPAYSIIVGFIFIEIVTLGVRLWFASCLVDFKVNYFLINVVLRCVPPIILSYLSAVCVSLWFEDSFFLFTVTILVSSVIFIVSTWLFTLNSMEKSIIKDIINRRKNDKKQIFRL
ncbi:MAG: hypothetical protein IJ494_03450 [Bacteroides sp.]|nr:hypothetical protein [Bacteroides sp.]